MFLIPEKVLFLKNLAPLSLKSCGRPWASTFPYTAKDPVLPHFYLKCRLSYIKEFLLCYIADFLFIFLPNRLPVSLFVCLIVRYICHLVGFVLCQLLHSYEDFVIVKMLYVLNFLTHLLTLFYLM